LILEFITSIDIEKSKNGGWKRRKNEILTVSEHEAQLNSIPILKFLLV